MKAIKIIKSVVSFTIITAVSFIIASAMGCFYVMAMDNLQGGISILFFGNILIALMLGAFDY